MNAVSRPRLLLALAFVAWTAAVVSAYFGAWGARGEPFATQGVRVLLLAGVLLGAWAAGGALLRLGLGDEEQPAPAALRLSLGLALLSHAWLALGAAGLLSAPVAWTALALSALAGLVALARGPRLAAPGGEALSRGAALALALALAGLVVVLPMALTPPVSTDELTYHLTLPKWNIEAGRIQAYPRFAHAAFPFQVEMLYTWALLLGQPVVAKLLHFGMGLLAVAVAGGLARREGGREAGAFAAALLLTTPVWLLNMSWAWADVATALYVLSGAALLLQLRRRPTLGLALLAGLAWGMALGTKYTSFLYLAIVAPACLWPGASERAAGGLLPLARRAALTLLVALLLASPWLVRNAVVHGNPTHPMGAGVWGPALEGDHERMTTHRGPRDTALDRIRGIAHYTFWNERADETLGFLWLLAVPVVLLRRPRDDAFRLALAGAASSVVLSAGFAGSVRYQIPALALLAPAVSCWLAEWWRAAGARRAAAVVLLAATAASNLPLLAWHDRELFDPVRVAFGLEREESYLLRMEKNYRVLKHLDHEEPRGSRVLAIGVERLFHLDAPVVTSGPLDVSPARDLAREAGSAEGLALLLRREGLTHVLIDRAVFDRDVRANGQGGAWRPGEIAILDDFLERVAEKVVRQESVELYRVPAAP